MEYSFNCGGLGGLPPRRRIVSIALPSCSSVNLSNRVDRSRGKHIVSRDYG